MRSPQAARAAKHVGSKLGVWLLVISVVGATYFFGTLAAWWSF